MLKYLIFDWGGVFAPGHLLKDFSNNLARIIGGEAEQYEKVFRAMEFPYETGEIDPVEFWQNFIREAKLKIPIDEVRNIFFNSYNIDSEMLEYAQELKKIYKIVLFTNNYQDLFVYIKSKYNLEKYFDHLFASSEIKFKKPDSRSYEFVLRELGIEANEAVFIDDKEKNVVAAGELGFKTILFQNLAQLKNELQK